MLETEGLVDVGEAHFAGNAIAQQEQGEKADPSHLGTWYLFYSTWFKQGE